MAGPGGYYGQKSKSDSERQTLCIITYMWNLKNKEIIILEKHEQTYREQICDY